jgi:hypothetical protein
LLALDDMRYRNHARSAGDAVSLEQQTQSSLELLRSVVATFLGELPPFEVPTQIEIVTDNVELWSLPFEFARDRAGNDLLDAGVRQILLTRRVRRTFAEVAQPWPEQPRVLFAWYGDVAVDPHRTAFYAALEPWIGPLDMGMVPNAGPVLTELRAASLADIAKACESAAANRRPYTHVHLLAHGAEIPGRVPSLSSFGVALNGGIADAPALTRALRAGQLLGPTVVTLAVCDSSNASNSLLSGGRLAYELHAKGVPVVIGSQFPLTEPGAAIFAQVFYKSILEDTADVRSALCKARAAPRTNELAGHDWASVTAHVRLPEGYVDQLRVASLRIQMTQLNTVSRWAQLIVDGKADASQETETRIDFLLEKRIKALEERIEADSAASESVTLEALGILASAHKRRAELVFSSREPAVRQRSEPILRLARDRYREAHERALSHHWTGTQYLALCAVADGHIRESNTVYWLAAMFAAERHVDEPISPGDDQQRERTIWALGSIAELCLLASKLDVPFGPRPPLEKAREALQRLVELARQEPHMTYAIDSTWRQLRRYVHWWTHANGYFEGMGDLSAAASELLPIVEPRPDEAT